MSLGIGENRWRVLRRLHLAGGAAAWNEARPGTRTDHLMLTGLEAAGLVLIGVAADEVAVELTARGRDVQELGLVTVAEHDLLGPPLKPAEAV